MSLIRKLNFNHLYYFWVAARVGGITAASRELHVSQATLSTQIKLLERSLGERLFARSGRRMILTSAGETALRHAEEMFRAAENMVQAIPADSASRPSLVVGASEAVPKLVIRSVLQTLRSATPPVTFVCREWRHEQLLLELALQRIDLAITEVSPPPSAQRPAVTCLLGESPIGLFGTPAIAERYRRGFPRSLSGAPFVLPVRGTALRERLHGWFAANAIRPDIVAEAEDRGLMKFMGQAGFGIIALAGVVEKQIGRQFGIKRIGWAEGVRDEYYAVTDEHRLKHPAIAAIFAEARRTSPPPALKTPKAALAGA